MSADPAGSPAGGAPPPAGAPPYWAYEYGTAVSWVTRLTHTILDRLFRGLDSVAGAVPFLVIAVAAGGITISQLMG